MFDPRTHLNVPLVLPAPAPLSMPPPYSGVRHPSAFHFLLNPSAGVAPSERSMLLPMPESIEVPRPKRTVELESDDQTRQIRFFHDRVDFRGDVIYKPARAKSKLFSFRSTEVDLRLQIAEFSGNFSTFCSKIGSTTRSSSGKTAAKWSFESFKRTN